MNNFAIPNRVLKNTIFVEDTIAAVREAGSFHVSVGNLTSNAQKVKSGIMLGTAASVRLVYQAVSQRARAHKDVRVKRPETAAVTFRKIQFMKSFHF